MRHMTRVHPERVTQPPLPDGRSRGVAEKKKQGPGEHPVGAGRVRRACAPAVVDVRTRRPTMPGGGGAIPADLGDLVGPKRDQVDDDRLPRPAAGLRPSRNESHVGDWPRVTRRTGSIRSATSADDAGCWSGGTRPRVGLWAGGGKHRAGGGGRRTRANGLRGLGGGAWCNGVRSRRGRRRRAGSGSSRRAPIASINSRPVSVRTIVSVQSFERRRSRRWRCRRGSAREVRGHILQPFTRSTRGTPSTGSRGSRRCCIQIWNTPLDVHLLDVGLLQAVLSPRNSSSKIASVERPSSTNRTDVERQTGRATFPPCVAASPGGTEDWQLMPTKRDALGAALDRPPR